MDTLKVIGLVAIALAALALVAYRVLWPGSSFWVDAIFIALGIAPYVYRWGAKTPPAESGDADRQL
jgi:hypothetical protein